MLLAFSVPATNLSETVDGCLTQQDGRCGRLSDHSTLSSVQGRVQHGQDSRQRLVARGQRAVWPAHPVWPPAGRTRRPRSPGEPGAGRSSPVPMRRPRPPPGPVEDQADTAFQPSPRPAHARRQRDIARRPWMQASRLRRHQRTAVETTDCLFVSPNFEHLTMSMGAMGSDPVEGDRGPPASSSSAATWLAVYDPPTTLSPGFSRGTPGRAGGRRLCPAMWSPAAGPSSLRGRARPGSRVPPDQVATSPLHVEVPQASDPSRPPPARPGAGKGARTVPRNTSSAVMAAGRDGPAGRPGWPAGRHDRAASWPAQAGLPSARA